MDSTKCDSSPPELW